MPAADLAWSLVAHDVFAPVVDDTPPALVDTAHHAAGDLPLIADVLSVVADVLDNTSSPADDLPPAVERPVP